MTGTQERRYAPLGDSYNDNETETGVETNQIRKWWKGCCIFVVGDPFAFSGMILAFGSWFVCTLANSLNKNEPSTPTIIVEVLSFF